MLSEWGQILSVPYVATVLCFGSWNHVKDMEVEQMMPWGINNLLPMAIAVLYPISL
jgi:hypothetical protein